MAFLLPYDSPVPKHLTVSAPGKLMLFGEHAVVYGKPCIVTAVGQRLRLTVTQLRQDAFELEAKDVQVTGYRKSMSQLGLGEIPKGARFIEEAVKEFSKRHPIPGGLKIETESDFTAKMGFGSSSAATVCAIKALGELVGVTLSNRDIFDLSYKTVLEIQKKGSGFDIAAAVYGGTLLFVRGGELIEPLSIKGLPLLIGYTGIKADTVELMDEVSRRMKKYPALQNAIYEQIEALVNTAKESLVTGDWVTAGECMDFNQGLLEALGVSSFRLASMIHAAREAGALGAKLSGAGKGDCMIALCGSDQRSEVGVKIEKAGGTVIDVETGVEGVRIEHGKQ